jgi:hypothetical protein
MEQTEWGKGVDNFSDLRQNFAIFFFCKSSEPETSVLIAPLLFQGPVHVVQFSLQRRAVGFGPLKGVRVGVEDAGDLGDLFCLKIQLKLITFVE